MEGNWFELKNCFAGLAHRLDRLLINTSDIGRRMGRFAGAKLVGIARGSKGADDDNNRRRGLITDTGVVSVKIRLYLTFA